MDVSTISTFVDPSGHTGSFAVACHDCFQKRPTTCIRCLACSGTLTCARKVAGCGGPQVTAKARPHHRYRNYRRRSNLHVVVVAVTGVQPESV